MFSISNTTKGKPPSLPFVTIKEAVLGNNYNLSLVFIGNIRSKTLNKTYRGKDYPANILSFPLSKNEGEIFINLNEARKSARRFRKNYKQFVGLLFIHGMLHLKGFKHSSKMEDEEGKIQKRFKI
jgi:probable rRNA maturation factor